MLSSLRHRPFGLECGPYPEGGDLGVPGELVKAIRSPLPMGVWLYSKVWVARLLMAGEVKDRAFFFKLK